MKMKLIVMLLLFTGLFAGHNVDHIHKELSHLKLTQKQSREIRDILQKFREDLKVFRVQRENVQERKKRLFTKNSFSLEELSNLHEDICKKKNLLEANLLRDIHNVLNKEQRFQFVQYLDEWKIQ